MSSSNMESLWRPVHPGRRVGPKKFAEPVSVSSTVFADLPLAGSAFELGFDLLRFRARRKRKPMAPARSLQGVENAPKPQFAEIQLSTFPQQDVQLVENLACRPHGRVRPCRTFDNRPSRAASAPSSGRSRSEERRVGKE